MENRRTGEQEKWRTGEVENRRTGELEKWRTGEALQPAVSTNLATLTTLFSLGDYSFLSLITQQLITSIHFIDCNKAEKRRLFTTGDTIIDYRFHLKHSFTI
jgi:hypothetical protein